MTPRKGGNGGGNEGRAVPVAPFPSVPNASPDVPGVPAHSQPFPQRRSLVPAPREGNGERRRALARAASRERQAAELLGTRRVVRSRYQSAPDVEPVTLPCGLTIQAEIKTRARLPSLVTKALEQAKGYGPAGSIPAAVLSAKGGEPVIVLGLRAFREIAGLEGATEPGPQVPLAFPELGPDERRVLESIAARLRMGARQYGALDVRGDARDWHREAAEELLDGCVYLACEAMRRKAG